MTYRNVGNKLRRLGQPIVCFIDQINQILSTSSWIYDNNLLRNAEYHIFFRTISAEETTEALYTCIDRIFQQYTLIQQNLPHIIYGLSALFEPRHRQSSCSLRALYPHYTILSILLTNGRIIN